MKSTPRLQNLWRSCCFLISLASLPACGSDATTSGDYDGSSGPLLFDGVREFLIDRANFGGPLPPQCDRNTDYPGKHQYTYNRDTRALTHLRCSNAKTEEERAAYPAKTRTLTTEEARVVEELLQGVRYIEKPNGDRSQCQYDGLDYLMRSGSFEASAFNTNCYGRPMAPRLRDVYESFANLLDP